MVTVFCLMMLTPLRAQETLKSTNIFSLKAIWNPPEELPQRIDDKCDSIAPSRKGSRWVNCIASEMRASGASSDAIKVAERLNGESYQIEFREFGEVDLAAVSSFSYNSPELSHQEILVNGTPTIVDPSSEIRGIEIRKDPNFPSLAKKFPNAELSSLYDFQTVKQPPKGGQRFIFSFTMLNGCRGCDVAGSAEIGFDFDKAGRFTKAKLLGLKSSK